MSWKIIGAVLVVLGMIFYSTPTTMAGLYAWHFG